MFSIITITYNASEHLEKTIQSVLNQSDDLIQYLIIDGGSTDGTIDIIKKYEAELQWISEPDKGLYDAMNKGLSLANEDYVWFINAGDILKEGIVKELATLIKQKRSDIIYGETDLIDEKGIILGARRLKTPKSLTWKSFRMGMLVCHQAFIVKREISPNYNLKYRFSADYDWCIRCMKQTNSILNSNLRLVNYLNEGMTTANRKESLKERYKIMCTYYGNLPTMMLHCWFAIRFYWAKWTKKII